MIGQTISQYRIMEKLGEDEMGAIFEPRTSAWSVPWPGG